jgi:hypothetical protein
MLTTLLNTLSKVLVTPVYYLTRIVDWVQYEVGGYRKYLLHQYALSGLDNLGLMGTIGLSLVLMPPVLWLAKRNKILAFMIGFMYYPQSAMVGAAIAWLWQ